MTRDVRTSEQCNKAMGRRLQRARADLDASEEFVATALGLSVEAYRAVEAGTAHLETGHVIRAAHIFGVEPAALATEEPRDTAGSADVIDLAAIRRQRKA